LKTHFSTQVVAAVFGLAILSTVARAADGQPRSTTPGPLLEAVAISFKDMKKAGIERHKYETDRYYIFSPVGTPESESTYPTEQAYFVRVKIDARALAERLYQDSCEPKVIFSRSTKCEPEELKTKVTEILKRGQTGDLYGKYRAGFEAFAGDTPIRKTAKFGGYDIYQFQRSGDIDVLFVGPMPGKATSLAISQDVGFIQVKNFNSAE